MPPPDRSNTPSIIVLFLGPSSVYPIFLHLCAFQFSGLKASVVPFSSLHIQWDIKSYWFYRALTSCVTLLPTPFFAFFLECALSGWIIVILIDLPIPHLPASAPYITVLTTSQLPQEALGSLHLSAPFSWSQVLLSLVLTCFPALSPSWGELNMCLMSP